MEKRKRVRMLDKLTSYLKNAKTMQVATLANSQPWVCTVYFVEDEFNLYWLSFPSRRHSQDLARNPRAAIAIQVKTDQPVIGIQAEGRVTEVKDKDIVQKVMEMYVNKYEAGRDFYENFLRGANQHTMYKFAPQKYVLFDEVNYSAGPRREIQLP